MGTKKADPFDQKLESDRIQLEEYPRKEEIVDSNDIIVDNQ